MYFWVDDIDALFKEFVERGAKIDYGLCNPPYGCREFGVPGYGRTRYRVWSGHFLNRLSFIPAVGEGRPDAQHCAALKSQGQSTLWVDPVEKGVDLTDFPFKGFARADQPTSMPSFDYVTTLTGPCAPHVYAAAKRLRSIGGPSSRRAIVLRF